jgi:hypothetical protein
MHLKILSLHQGEGGGSGVKDLLARVPKMLVDPYGGSPAGPGPKQFLVKAEQLKIGQNIPDRKFLDQWVPTLLVDDALEWFLDQPTWRTWGEFKVDFMQQFQLPNADDVVHEAILRRRQKDGEGIAEYAEEMLKLFRQLLVTPSEKEKIRLIYRNMVKDLRILLSRESFVSVRSMIGEARRVEAAALGDEPPFSGAVGPKRQQSVQEPRRGPPPNQGVSDRVCFTCGEAGHFSRACPQRVVGNTTDSGNAPGTSSVRQGGSQSK